MFVFRPLRGHYSTMALLGSGRDIILSVRANHSLLNEKATVGAALGSLHDGKCGSALFVEREAVNGLELGSRALQIRKMFE